MVYSGNTDLCGSFINMINSVCINVLIVPTVGTRGWVDQLRNELNLGLVESMRNWYYVPDAPASTPNSTMP